MAVVPLEMFAPARPRFDPQFLHADFEQTRQWNPLASPENMNMLDFHPYRSSAIFWTVVFVWFLMVVSETYFLLYISAVRELIDALNKESASGLIPHHALPLLTVIDKHTRNMERLLRNAQSRPAPQQ